MFSNEVQRWGRFRAGFAFTKKKKKGFGGKTALQNQLQFKKHEIYTQTARGTYRSVFYESRLSQNYSD